MNCLCQCAILFVPDRPKGSRAVREGTSSGLNSLIHLTNGIALQASQLRPDEPKFTSNSSAAEYEAGRYLDCIKSVAQAWKKIDAKCVVDDLAVWEPFRLKLATRFFKANLHLQASTKDRISHLQGLGQVLEEDAKVFRAIEDYASHQEASSSDPKIKELLATWKELVRTRTSDSAIAQVPEQEAAEIRFRALPICKWPR